MKCVFKPSRFFLIGLFSVLFLSSCEKKIIELVSEEIPVLTQTSFTWQEENGDMVKADSAYWTTGAWGTGIRAFKDTDTIEINWSAPNDTIVGTKVLPATLGFTYKKAGTIYTNTNAEDLILSPSITAGKITGLSNIAALSGGTITGVSVVFSNLPKL